MSEIDANIHIFNKTCLDCVHHRLLLREEALICFFDRTRTNLIDSEYQAAAYCNRYEEDPEITELRRGYERD